MPGNKGFRYAYSPNQLSDVLQKIQETGRPDKLTFPYMRDTWLFKNAQYSAVLDLLEDMGFIDTSGTPSSVYAEYQNPIKAKECLANAIKRAYPDLYKAYPNAHSLQKEILVGYFKQQTGAEQSVLDKTVGTFLKLCSFADFSNASEINTINQQTKVDALKPTIPGQQFIQDQLAPSIHIDIQIHLSSDTTPEQIDQIFASMAKHLYQKKN